MGIGAGIFMLAVGAIITFAFNVRVGWLDLDIVGWVLMVAGAFSLIMTFVLMNRRRTTAVTTAAPVQDPAYGAPTTQRVVEERSTYDADRPL